MWSLTTPWPLHCINWASGYLKDPEIPEGNGMDISNQFQ
jgi:hypothetical protein